MSLTWEESGLLRDGAPACEGAASEALFAALVHRYAELLFKIAYTFVRSVADAEDCVRDALLKLHRSGAWMRAENERAFLARTVWRVALDRRRHRRGPERSLDSASQAADPEQCAIANDATARVQRLIDALPDYLRQPLVLSALKEMTSSEIGTLLGIPDATVRQRILRARQLLRQKLEALEYGR